MPPKKVGKSVPAPREPSPEPQPSHSRSRGRPSGTDSENSKKKKRLRPSFAIYSFKVLKQVHNSLGISSKAMNIVNDIVYDLFLKLLKEVGELSKMNKTATGTGRESQTSVRLIFPGELAAHAVSESAKAVALYNRHRS